MYKNNINESFGFEALGVVQIPLFMNEHYLHPVLRPRSFWCLHTYNWFSVSISLLVKEKTLKSTCSTTYKLTSNTTYLYYKLIFGVFKFVKNRGKKLLIKPTILNRSKIDLLGVKQIFMLIFHDNIDQIMVLGG